MSTARLPNADGRYDLVGLIASDWGRHDPEKATVWVLTLPPGTDRQQAILGLEQSWADLDSRKAAEFALSLPTSPERQAMFSTATDRWAASNPVQVGEWLLQYKQHPDFDQVVAAVVTSESIVNYNVKVAIGWADSIADPPTRLEALTNFTKRVIHDSVCLM